MTLTLREQILATQPGRLPSLLDDPATEARLEDQWAAFEAFLRANPDTPIYAVNTLTGHRDRDGAGHSPDAVNRAIADSHYFPPVSTPDPRLWRLIGLCKLVQLAMGGAPLRPAVFQALRDQARQGDVVGGVDLAPSYSSGDVLPGCQWAIQSLNAAGVSVEALGPGGMIALINGVFVHLGAALWSLERLEAPLARDRSQSRRARDLLENSPRYRRAQAPVSVRAMGQPQAALKAMTDHAGAVIDRLLGAPSGNPLFHTGPPARFESQDSFMSCELAVVQSGVIEAVLALAWTVNQRTKHLCAAFGDGAAADNPIALIQHPKMSEGVLQLMRLRNGTRPYASGGDTSEGIEDFWSHGAHLALAAADIADQLERMLAIEAEVLDRIEGLRGT